MATVILRTTAGAAYDLAVRNGTAPQSPLKHIVLHTGAAVTDVVAIMALTAVPGVEDHRFTYDPDGGINSFAITEETPTSTRYVAHLSENVGNGKTFTGIALLLENGTLWGYAPYLPDGGGLSKTLAMTWELDLLVVEGNAQMLSVSYEPLDYRAMRDRLLTEIRAELNIHEMAAMLEQAMRLCTIDGNESGWTLDGGNPSPECQLIPIDQQLNAVDGGTI
jgi:hypothetical protein